MVRGVAVHRIARAASVVLICFARRLLVMMVSKMVAKPMSIAAAIVRAAQLGMNASLTAIAIAVCVPPINARHQTAETDSSKAMKNAMTKILIRLTDAYPIVD